MADEEVDWEEMYEFAKKQTIIGVLFAGIEKLPKAQRPEKKLLMKWYAQTERIKQKNKELKMQISTKILFSAMIQKFIFRKRMVIVIEWDQRRLL